MFGNGNKAKAWVGVFDYPIPGRKTKPRQEGLTMLIDKGLGLAETRDLLELAGDYIDFLKLSFGSSALYSRELLEEKIALLRSLDLHVYPGGTFLEVAILQGRLKDFLARARELGFTALEVSDGTIQLDEKRREEAIKSARDSGFLVLTEVGKKDLRENPDFSTLLDMIAQDLSWGAFKVTLEARESGKGVGIFDREGNIKWGQLEAIASSFSPEDIFWEAPLKNQQEELILRFGPNVNLGNVQVFDVLSVEALRVGLRSDTLKEAHRFRSGEEREFPRPVLVQAK